MLDGFHSYCTQKIGVVYIETIYPILIAPNSVVRSFGYLKICYTVEMHFKIEETSVHKKQGTLVAETVVRAVLSMGIMLCRIRASGIQTTIWRDFRRV